MGSPESKPGAPGPGPGESPAHGPERAREEPLEVHACTAADRPRQLELFRACFKKPLELAGLAWRYDDNPCGRAISFVTRTPEGRAVSGYACNPRIALARGEHAAVVGETGDVMTHPDFRKRGLFSALDRAAMAAAKQAGWPVVFGLPNRRSAHIFPELGWKPVGTVRPWNCVLRNDGAAREERGKQGRLARWGVGFAFARANRARRAMARAAEGLSVRAIERGFPPEVDALALQVARRFDWMIRRDRRYLDWRFLAAPSGLFRALELRGGDGALAAIVVVQLPRPGSAVGYLVDALAQDDRALSAAIGAGLDVLERQGASVAEATAIDGSFWRDVLRRHGFVPPRSTNCLTVIVHVHDSAHPLAHAASDPRRWYFTDADRDDETMG